MDSSNIMIIPPKKDTEEGSEQMPTVIEVITIPASTNFNSDTVLVLGDNNVPQSFQINSSQASDGQPRIIQISDSDSHNVSSDVQFVGSTSNQVNVVTTQENADNSSTMTNVRIVNTVPETSDGNIVFHLNPALQVGRKRKHPQKPGKYICTYCGRGCAKPSVLQKHIRAHTGERPYPCEPCGFSFKTKSNLYKHCKSRAHAIKAGKTSVSSNSGSQERSVSQESDINEGSADINTSHESIDEENDDDENEDDEQMQDEPAHKVLKIKDDGEKSSNDSSMIIHTVSSPGQKKTFVIRDRVKTVKDLLQERKTEKVEDAIQTKTEPADETIQIVKMEPRVTSESEHTNTPVTLASTVQRIDDKSVKVTIQFPKKQVEKNTVVATSTAPNLKLLTPDEVKDRINQLLVSNKQIVEPDAHDGDKMKSRKLVRQLAVEEEDVSNVQSIRVSTEEMVVPTSQTLSKGGLNIESSKMALAPVTPINLSGFQEREQGVSPIMIVQQLPNTSESQVVFVIPENKNLLSLNNMQNDANAAAVSPNIMSPLNVVQPVGNANNILTGTSISPGYQCNSHSVDHAQDNAQPLIIEQVDPSQKRKKGRPKGSKNRPKPGHTPSLSVASNASLNISTITNPKKDILQRSQSVSGYQIIQPKHPTEPKVVEPIVQNSLLSENQVSPNSNNDQSLWKLKLKGRLLMKRSISTERSIINNEMEEVVDNIKSVKYARSHSVNIPTHLATETPYTQDSGLVIERVETVTAQPESQTSEVLEVILPVNKGSVLLTPTVTFTPLLPSKGLVPPLLDQVPENMSPERYASDTGLYTSKEETNLAGENKSDDKNNDISFSERQCVPLLLLGHQYPVIRTDTAPSFCSAVRLQPMYVTQGSNNKLSMYSNWKVASHNPNPLGLPTKTLLSTYQTFRSSQDVALSVPNLNKRKVTMLTHSSYWNVKVSEEEDCVPDASQEEIVSVSPEINSNVNLQVVQNEETVETSNVPYPLAVFKSKVQPVQERRVAIFPGGYKSFDEYIYIRGRGRGRFVCEECGIRCKKPSMLKKHIRTHTDLRPFNCKHCEFSFKTKGNLTKHMKSKSHYRKCMELGLDPIPTLVDDSQIDAGVLQRQCSNMSNTSQVEEQVVEEEIHVDIEVSDDEEGNHSFENNTTSIDMSRSITTLFAKLRVQIRLL